MNNQKTVLGFSIIFGLLILIAVWFYTQSVVPAEFFPFSGLKGLIKLLSMVFGIGLVVGLAIYFVSKIILPPTSGMTFKEYLLRPDERTMRIRYQVGTYILPFIAIYFGGVWSFFRLVNPALGLDLMLYGFNLFVFLGVPLIFRYLEKRH